MKKFLLFVLLATASMAVNAQALTNGGKVDPRQAIMDVRHYTISLDVNFKQHSIDGFTTIDVIMAQPTKVLLFNLLDSLHISKILVNNKAEKFEYKDNKITINLSNTLPAGKASVKVYYSGKPHVARRPPWDDGFIWSRDSTGHPWMGITEEGAGGKLYFPCKDSPSDEPNEGVDMIVTVPKHLVVAGPGLLQGVTKSSGKTTYHWKTNYTINNYSIVFTVGNFADVSRKYTTVNGNTVPIHFYVLKEHEAKASHHLNIFEKTIHEQEKYFGEYPWVKEKIGIVEAPYLGMEHQTMNGYGNNFNYTKVGGEDYDELMHHEFGHEWWGNKVTAKDWADYWIHEGICTFGDALYIREFDGEGAYNKYFQRAAFGFENEKPIVQHPDMDEESAYIGDIYGKGAFFMHTLRYVMGDSLFFPALKKFVTSPKYTYDNLVNTDDVEQFFTQQAGHNLKPLFDLYLRTTNKLEIDVKETKPDTYVIRLQNISIPLPVDVTTSAGTKRVMLDDKGVAIESSTTPVIDRDMFYLKKVIFE